MNTRQCLTFAGPGEAEIMRDIIRDICRVSVTLAEQYARFAATGTLSFAELDALLGQDMRQGVLWRLKDNAHQHLRPSHNHCGRADPAPTDNADANADALLDWCVGYIFHACVKLREDAFLKQHYAARLAQICPQTDCTDICAALSQIMGHTVESIQYELARIRTVLEQAHISCIHCLALRGENGPLARFLVEDAALVRAVFGERVTDLHTALYGTHPERIYLCAAQACMDGGRPQQALYALDTLTEYIAQHDITADKDTLTHAADLRHQATVFDTAYVQNGAAKS